VTETLEWWPDYGGGPLWKVSGRGGQQADSGALDLPPDLAARLAAWNQRYAEDKLPITGNGDPEWLEQGVSGCSQKSVAARRADSTSVISEPWGEEPHG
jgi:hypothetical protein